MRSYNLIKHLYKKDEITLFCYIREDRERKYIPELEKYCRKVIVFKRRKAWSPFNILLSAVSFYPFLVSIYLSRSLRRAVNLELESEHYDLIHAETFYVMTNISQNSLPTILVEQTIDYLVYQHYTKSFRFPGLRPFLNIDVLKLKYWERYFWKKAGKVVAVSEADKKEMLELEPDLDVDLVPNGVDLDFFIPKKSWRDPNPKILFVSNFKWLQNLEAARFLIIEVFPKVFKEIPNSQLWIVGQHPPKSITDLQSKNVKIDSLEERDVETIRKVYNQASVFVSPMKGPGGTRLKNLAAMASKLPIVTTTIGAEGIGVKDGITALIRDESQDISSAIVDILRNPALGKKLAQSARKLAEEEYSWEKMAQKLDKVYKEACAKR